MLDNPEVKAVVTLLKKKHGEGVMFIPGDKVQQPSKEVVSTGVLSLDIALGIGGIERGRLVEIYGPESSGKTTLALSLVAQEQAEGRDVLYIDTEHALSQSHCSQLGVDLEKLIISQPDSAEQVFEIIDLMTKTGSLGMIVVDSLAALLPNRESEVAAGKPMVASIAAMMSPFCRRIKGTCNKTNTSLIFINQLREKVGVMFGNPETTPGGRALKFYAYYRFDVRIAGQIKAKPSLEIIGHELKIKVVKNKSAPPFKVAEAQLLYGSGIDNVGCVLDLAKDLGIIDLSGAWYTYGEERWQGKENAKEGILPHINELESRVREAFGIKNSS